ncbi:hypothetical protein DXG01_009466 [Tephrocybe rancida]|nr:hypothetical protein DXG01_009466 [Tephrocybe rancida]
MHVPQAPCVQIPYIRPSVRPPPLLLLSNFFTFFTSSYTPRAKSTSLFNDILPLVDLEATKRGQRELKAEHTAEEARRAETLDVIYDQIVYGRKRAREKEEEHEGWL